MKKPLVHILLSTYNGDTYLGDQLHSLMNQTYNNFIIHVRDDGSSDNTPKILKEWKKKYPQIFKVDLNKNVGVINSFIELLKDVYYQKGDLFAFCDQDDVWLNNKLELAVNTITSSKTPESALYCSRLEYVDNRLNHLHFSLIPRNKGFNNAVIENIATGCTVVFGESIRKYLLQADTKHMIMHDWWAYLIASTFGEVIYDKTPTIKYRQHGSSVTPDKEYGLSRIVTRIINFYKRLFSKNHIGLESLDQAYSFINTYQNIPSENCKVVNEILALRKSGVLLKRLKYILKPCIYRVDPVENILLKPMILFGLH